MDIQYKIIYDKRFYKDLLEIESKTYMNFYKKLKKDIDIKIENLKFMPRTHKSLIYYKDKYGEYRRIVSGKYIIIYKIVKDEIIILRIFNQKENYLNQKGFIVKEESEIYMVNRRRKNNIMKLKTLKNTYSKLRENYTHILTKDEAMLRYMNLLIDEAEEDLRNGAELITLEEWREELIREYNVVL